MKIIMLSGPVGAGKTTVARDLLALLPAPLSYIEGDTFWPLIVKSDGRNRREQFGVIMRAMTAAAIPFARSEYTVLLDFSIPPDFLQTARKIVKEVPLEYIILRPGINICEARALQRKDGSIADYTNYRDFYALFERMDSHSICDDEADSPTVARRILNGLDAGVFRV